MTLFQNSTPCFEMGVVFDFGILGKKWENIEYLRVWDKELHYLKVKKEIY